MEKIKRIRGIFKFIDTPSITCPVCNGGKLNVNPFSEDTKLILSNCYYLATKIGHHKSLAVVSHLSNITGKSNMTIYRWLKKYRKQGLEYVNSAKLKYNLTV